MAVQTAPFPYHKLPTLDKDSDVAISVFVDRMRSLSLEGMKHDPLHPEDRVAVMALMYKLRNVPSFAALLVVFEVDAKEAFSSCTSTEYFKWIEWVLDHAKMFVRELFPRLD